MNYLTVEQISKSYGELELFSDLSFSIHKDQKIAFIAKNGMDVTRKAIDYLAPLIEGEAFPPFKNGIPEIKKLKLVEVKKKLAQWC